jgi:hypothetical protein
MPVHDALDGSQTNARALELSPLRTITCPEADLTEAGGGRDLPGAMPGLRVHLGMRNDDRL